MNDSFTVTTLMTVIALVVTGCKPAKNSVTKAPPPAEVSKKISESDLIKVKLTSEAEKRLGITLARAAIESITRFQEYSGELLFPLAAGQGTAPRSIFGLVPGMTSADLVRIAQMQVEADGQVAVAKVQLEGAKLALLRAEELIANKAGAGKIVDEARLQVKLGEGALQTAEERRALLGSGVLDEARRDALWVRVTLYAGDVAWLETTTNAQLRAFGTAQTNSAPVEIKAMRIPISTPGAAPSGDLYYEFSSQGDFRPGQKVLISIPKKANGQSLVVPASAILYDIHGGAWVYEKVEAQTFARRRVEVRDMVRGKAVLARGLSEGAEVVTNGAAELFGTEFGAGK